MASISTDKNGNRTIQVVCSDGKRRSIRLGKMPKKAVQEVKTKVEALNAAATAKLSIDRETARWLGSIDDGLYKKLVAVKLVEPRAAATPDVKPQQVRLGEFIDSYIAGRVKIKASTRVNLGRCRKLLTDFFGEDRPMGTITAGEADDFREHLSRSMAENTVRRTCGRAKQFFRAAVRKKLVADSPFADMKGTSVKANRSRDYFVSRDEADAILTACPDNEWRLIFALSRYGGLRCPSEHLGLRWVDVDWERQRIRVQSPKTAHHEGHEERIMPLFPELRPYLEAAWDEAPEGAEFVITRYRDTNSNLRTQLNRIIRRAGLTHWPKLFQNLRASRATELAKEHPGHVAAAWLGHSTKVADKHYWQVTDDDFAKAVQKAVQSAAVPACNEPSDNPMPLSTTAEYKALRYLTPLQVTPTGLEPVLPA